MSDCAIVNLATRNAWYPKGQTRLLNSLKHYGGYEFLPFTDEDSVGAPSHRKVPYAFKLYAIKAARERGYKRILWVDASMWAIKDPWHVFERIVSHGYLIIEAAQWLGNWSTDASLAHWGLTRDEAMTIPMWSGGFVGLDFTNAVACEFFQKWWDLAHDGVSFIGPYRRNNEPDQRFRGHRHDMSAGSYISHKMKMEIEPNTKWFDYYVPKPKEWTYFLARGM
jgi:hypothetical protein